MSSQVPAHQPSQDSVWPDDLAVADAVPLPVLFDEEKMLQDDFASPMQQSRDNNWLRERWQHIQALATEEENAPAECTAAEAYVIALQLDCEDRYLGDGGWWPTNAQRRAYQEMRLDISSTPAPLYVDLTTDEEVASFAHNGIVYIC